MNLLKQGFFYAEHHYEAPELCSVNLTTRANLLPVASGQYEDLTNPIRLINGVQATTAFAPNCIWQSKLVVCILKVMRWHWKDGSNARLNPPLLNLLLVRVFFFFLSLVVLTWLPNDDIQMRG